MKKAVIFICLLAMNNVYAEPANKDIDKLVAKYSNMYLQLKQRETRLKEKQLWELDNLLTQEPTEANMKKVAVLKRTHANVLDELKAYTDVVKGSLDRLTVKQELNK